MFGLRNLFRKSRTPLGLWHHEAYHLPLAGAEGVLGLDVRRADDAFHWLLESKTVLPGQVNTPSPISYADLSRVHTDEWLESLSRPQTLERIYPLPAAELNADELVKSSRLACGGTLEAARAVLGGRAPVALNLLGGFHHAGPGKGGGFCLVNDLAVAIQAVRADGFDGRVAILDLDAHPPDGTAACFPSDPKVWLGSISGANWESLPNVDETVLPKGAGDRDYLSALDALLMRMPHVQLAFVIAGGDVIAGDRLGTLGLSLAGARKRELKVAAHFAKVPTVWTPGGGYGPHSWKVLAGVGVALAYGDEEPIPAGYDPLAARYKSVSRSMSPDILGGGALLSNDELDEMFGARPKAPHRLLGFYTREGLEFALEKFGVLPLLRRLGFSALHMTIESVGLADRARLLGVDDKTQREAVLVELELERKALAGGTFLFVNWLSLRNPRAEFSSSRPQLPGQEVPGLGLARETTQMLGLMAKRLLLDGVAFRPSWYHMAYAARHSARFVAADRQGRFEALMRDLRGVSLLDATRALAENRVLLDGQPYRWEADEMVQWLEPSRGAADQAQIAEERDRRHFTLA